MREWVILSITRFRAETFAIDRRVGGGGRGRGGFFPEVYIVLIRTVEYGSKFRVYILCATRNRTLMMGNADYPKR